MSDVITGPGNYRTRDGRRAIVTGYDHTSKFCWDGVIDSGVIAGDKHERERSWRRDGFEYCAELPKGADIIGAWHDPAPSSTTPAPSSCAAYEVPEGWRDRAASILAAYDAANGDALTAMACYGEQALGLLRSMLAAPMPEPPKGETK